jgi:hypothetical protein
LGYLFVREFVHVAENEWNSEGAGHRIQNLADKLPITDRAGQMLCRGLNLEFIELVDLRLLDANVRPALLPLQMGKTVVNLYSLKPMPKGRPSFETAESEKHLNQNLLSEILSIVWIPRDVPAVGDDPSLITQD